MLFFLTAYNYTPWVILTLPENQDLLFYLIYLLFFLMTIQNFCVMNQKCPVLLNQILTPELAEN